MWEGQAPFNEGSHQEKSISFTRTCRDKSIQFSAVSWSVLGITRVLFLPPPLPPPKPLPFYLPPSTDTRGILREEIERAV